MRRAAAPASVAIALRAWEAGRARPRRRARCRPPTGGGSRSDSVFIGVVNASSTFLPVFLLRLGASGQRRRPADRAAGAHGVRARDPVRADAPGPRQHRALVQPAAARGVVELRGHRRGRGAPPARAGDPGLARGLGARVAALDRGARRVSDGHGRRRRPRRPVRPARPALGDRRGHRRRGRRGRRAVPEPRCRSR